MITPESIAVLSAFVLGLLCGSFLNVCILRLPAAESILAPRSHCRVCQQPIRAFDNIPILSWLFLRGRCRHCGQKISAQYPLVEATTGVLFAACVLHTGLHGQTLLDIAMIFFLLGLAVMDAQTFLLPDAFTLGGLATAFALRVFRPFYAGNRVAAMQAAYYTLAAALAAALLVLLIRWLYRWIRKQDGIGLGDVKLLAMIAAFLGFPLTLLTFFLAILSGAMVSIVQLARGRAHAQQRLPFGSFLAASGIAVLFIGRPLLHWYVGFFR